MNKQWTWAPIIPLIGGMPLAMEQVLGNKPECVFSYTPFGGNDSHYLNYIRNQGWTGDYIVLDGESIPIEFPDLDIVVGTPPCAGLSSFSVASSADSPINDWMKLAAEFVLWKLHPKIYWFENAPHLATQKGLPIANTFFDYAQKYGYTFLLYTTESRLHGNCQIRPRTFGFFFSREYFGDFGKVLRDVPIRSGIFEEFMKSVVPQGDQMDSPINNENPMINAYYDYCYHKLEAKDHRDFVEKVCSYEKPVSLMEKALYLETDLSILEKWFEENHHDKAAKKMQYIQKKRDEKRGLWTHGATIGRGIIPGFIGLQPLWLIHPYEQRYVTFREGLTLMGFPMDFQLVGNPWAVSNHISQNVPVGTAADMVKEIVYLLENPTANSIDADYLVQRHKQGDIQVRHSIQVSEQFFS